MHDPSDGTLILAATPIGSSDDASQKLRDALTAADLIAAEDTRRFLTLARRLGITPKARVVSYFEGNEASRTRELVEAVGSGQRVVLVTDAGMPSVSDPGYRVVTACIDEGLRVTAVPGPSAVLTALAVSGLKVDRFCFEGFLPRKAGERRRRLAALATEERTMVFFEAPHRLQEFLTDAATELGEGRRGAICRELTKPYEEIIRGPLSELAQWAAGEVRGEVTVVIGGAVPQETSADDALALVRQAMAGGAKLSAAVADVAKITGTSRKALYAAALADKEK
ncbi:16S rRNA (cytidine(1402)-2'-O)-methyltransferase [Tessaracoccus sp. MC1865]|uniref:16S rRNA (cytidine(1402)-2'-O)-methyltransferase n=1 Tax=Tessaracoccus sp. MC1865 TaxID=2760310 RepID=UPI001602CB5E|nr:16S rRNA (cytidine(1402)-2'-O)-methyltransferase [Tessaracoccus sp. MC1865]MBB1482456.1 16S rRNA (cytidine(1402)-2'-O)-methyltransferase [Tessaracoccus sp. MC1865]QTO38088.1 16S rRNA (cytidine(1402)-2'-O)-methyltransferase [Tessaracoccus sp. MC1865]